MFSDFDVINVVLGNGCIEVIEIGIFVKVVGWVEDIYVNEGDRVEVGDVVVKLDIVIINS